MINVMNEGQRMARHKHQTKTYNGSTNATLTALAWFQGTSFHQSAFTAQTETVESNNNACPKCSNGRLGKNGVCGICFTCHEIEVRA